MKEIGATPLNNPAAILWQSFKHRKLVISSFFCETKTLKPNFVEYTSS